MKLATNSITIRTTTSKRNRDGDGGQQDEDGGNDLQQQSQREGHDQGHVSKRPRLTTKTMTTTLTKKMVVEVPAMAPASDEKAGSESMEDEEEASSLENASMDGNLESEDEYVDFQAIADGPGVRRRLFPDHAPTPGRNEGSDFADIVVVKRETESPPGMPARVSSAH